MVPVRHARHLGHRPTCGARWRGAAALAAALGVAAAFAGAGAGGDASGSAGDAVAPPAGGACAPSRPTRVPQPTAAQLRAAGLDELPIAPDRRRVDLVAPPFSGSTRVTNPLFPILRLRSAVLNGHVDGRVFRVETTLLPRTRIIEWRDGQCVETLLSQYVAYLRGRIEEVAVDHYAQADDGSVWYLGEDVFNYRDGVIADTEGTWHAGDEGPAAMIMPAHPRPGAAYRSENVPGLVFEEVTVRRLERVVPGPFGPVRAMVARELHDDGTHEDKLFAPGYGEFSTAAGGDVEALALAVPTDAARRPVPPALATLSAGADRAFALAGGGRFGAVRATVRRMDAAWRRLRRSGAVARRLDRPTARALAALGRAAAARDRRAARGAALDTALAALDLELRYRRVPAVDLDRFDVWLRRVLVDAGGGRAHAVSGDVATLEWIRDRLVGSVPKAALTRLDTGLVDVRASVPDGELDDAAAGARALRRVVARLAG